MPCKSIKSNKYWKTLIGIGLITLLFGKITEKDISDDLHNIFMLRGMFFGLAIAFILLGSFKLFQNHRTPEAKLKVKEIEAKDERNIKILRISHSIANLASMIMFGGMAFLFVGLNYIIPAIISLGAMYIQIIIFNISYGYYNKRM